MTKNIIITGGGLSNKGAQAMLFTAIDEAKKRFPYSNIIVLSDGDYKNKNNLDGKYKFSFKPDIFKYFFSMGIYSKLKNISSEEINEARNILKDTGIMINVSGYALGSNWGLKKQLYYLSNIRVAKRYGIRVYLMPQSFGPFKYKSIMSVLMKKLIKFSLEKCDVIYAREKESFDELTQNFKLTNVILSPDLVIRNKEINYHNVFEQIPETITEPIKQNSIAIIPNMKNFEFGNKDEVISLYRKAIDSALNHGMNVYLIRHSSEDVIACNILNELYPDNSHVIFLAKDYSSIEFNEIVKNMNFVVASRYHSIVHAYKNKIPCIAIGWATKYYELLRIFKQEAYISDVRRESNNKSLENTFEKMLDRYVDESRVIGDVLIDVQTKNIFDVIKS